MIDTDKYEGHTPAPWWCNEDDWRCIDTMVKHETGEDLEEVCRVNYREVDYDGKPLPNGPVGFNRATAQLIADAPLLLEEVKRLREVNDDLICELQGFQEAVKEDEASYKDLVASLEGIEEELKAEVKRLREEVKVLSKYRDIVTEFDDALLADGDTDIRWSAIYDERVFE